MAAGQEVLTQDLPSELFETTIPDSPTQMQPDSWATLLGQWADRRCVPVIKTCFQKRSRRWSARC
jgi:two-component system nitrogen regulation response regulator GlnG